MKELPHQGPDFLKRPATKRLLIELLQQDLISAEEFDQAVQLIRPPRQWWLWIQRGLLFLGGTLALAGVIFFFAFNWERLPSFGRFAIIQAGLWSADSLRTREPDC